MKCNDCTNLGFTRTRGGGKQFFCLINSHIQVSTGSIMACPEDSIEECSQFDSKRMREEIKEQKEKESHPVLYLTLDNENPRAAAYLFAQMEGGKIGKEVMESLLNSRAEEDEEWHLKRKIERVLCPVCSKWMFKEDSADTNPPIPAFSCTCGSGAELHIVRTKEDEKGV